MAKGKGKAKEDAAEPLERLIELRGQTAALEAELAELPREVYAPVPLQVGNLRRECLAFVRAVDRLVR